MEFLYPTYDPPVTFGTSQIMGGVPGPSGMIPDPRRHKPNPWPSLVQPYNAWAAGSIGQWIRPQPRPWPQKSAQGMLLATQTVPTFLPGWTKPPPSAFSGF